MLRLRPTTVRARLTLWYTLTLSLPLIGFAFASYFIFSRALRERTDAFIGDALGVFSRELVSERRTRPTIDDAIQATVREVRFRQLDIVVLDDSASVVAMSEPLPSPGERTPGRGADSAATMAALAGALPLADSMLTVHRSDGRYRVIVHTVPVGVRQYHVAGIYPLADVEQTLERIRKPFIVAIPLLVVIAATGGWFLARRSLAPVSAMALRAAEIGAATLHERLPVATEDELGRLARVLNDLLDRLERSFAQQRRFMADASHELRTPTAILRTEADVTLSRDHRSEGEYRESMAVVQDASRRLTRIVEDIFLLARADAGHLVLHAQPLDLEDLVHDIVRSVRPIAERRDVTVELLDVVEAPTTGDADLLGRVVLNLLDNAIKHSADGGRVEVRLARAGRTCTVDVLDEGPGVPSESRDRIFERFYRADSARSRAERSATSGAGLGLSISRRIAELHGGRLDLVESRPGRTVFRLTLP
jgi:two-component system OmpR family sensor kinase